jgi:hypothetical protein
MGTALAVAAVLGRGFLSSLVQLLGSPWMVVISGAVLMLAGILTLKRRSRITPWPKDPKPAGPPCFRGIGARGGTAPMDVIGAEVDHMLGGSDQDA